MQSVKPVVRSMKKQDVDGVYEVERASFTSPWTKYMLVEELSNSKAHYMVIDADGEILGYCGFWKIIDEAHITNVAVHPEYRGQGYGRVLISAMIQRAKELDVIAMTLEVRVSNDIAISLYKDFGFVASGVRKNYYQDNSEDALIMWLKM
ncbi:MAG: ribosomal protein S18-alanine N-acetyltransferase [Clostridiaceae bacterium]|jgi:ribosomal-protein-alanine N-acetyltransferase|nr:ribosomal protein S18-alanine N-acetyltransferase [Clostridiaceae bacterium]